MKFPKILASLFLASTVLELAADPNIHGRSTTKTIDFDVCAAEPPEVGSSLFVTDTRLCWNSGKTLRVQFLDGTSADAEFVIAAAGEWSRHAAVSFVQVPSNGEVRVTFALPGFSSRIGKGALDAPAGTPTMRLGFRVNISPAERRRLVLHEFGHALGFAHEQSSPTANIRWKRDKVIAYYKKWHGWKADKTEANVLRQLRPDDAPHGLWSQFDRESIMLYPIPKELVEPGTFTQSLNRELSALDKQKAAFLYPRIR